MLKKVAIVGAGLGGLAAAVALRKLGLDVQVYEKAQDFRPVGGGLGLLPNGLRSLEAIEPGIIEEIKKSGCEVQQTVLKNTQGETIRTNVGNIFKEKYGVPLITVWWWRLQQVLASKLPDDSIHLNHRCVGFQQDDNGVEISFENGKKGTAYRARTDLLIGADGINSAVRNILISDGEPRYSGSMSWRAVINCKQEVINPGELGFVRGEGEFMFLLNVGDGYLAWLYRQKTSDSSLSQSPAEVKSRVLDKLVNWGDKLRHLVEATPDTQILEGAICDRLPLESWSQGRVTLLGDAAHPMAPALAQGSNTTFEDARELALCISQSSDIGEALKNYEQRRIPRTQLIQGRSAIGEMRYYEKDTTESDKQMQEQSGMTNDEFQDWLYKNTN